MSIIPSCTMCIHRYVDMDDEPCKTCLSEGWYGVTVASKFEEKEETEMNYPKRGCMSDDGKFYTHTDGSVHERLHYNGCGFCSVRGDCHDKNINHHSVICREDSMWKRIEGAYAPSDEEREACDMARKAIVACGLRYNGRGDQGCGFCLFGLHQKMCHLRAYLAAHHQPDAWEANP